MHIYKRYDIVLVTFMQCSWLGKICACDGIHSARLCTRTNAIWYHHARDHEGYDYKHVYAYTVHAHNCVIQHIYHMQYIHKICAHDKKIHTWYLGFQDFHKALVWYDVIKNMKGKIVWKWFSTNEDFDLNEKIITLLNQQLMWMFLYNTFVSVNRTMISSFFTFGIMISMYTSEDVWYHS